MTYTADSLFKVLRPDRMPAHGGSGQWPEPGEWHSVTGTLIPCENGLHLCRPLDIARWHDEDCHVLWSVEAGPRTKRLDATDKVVVRKARLIEPVTTWTERSARLFACDCAEHVLPIYERHSGDNSVLRATIAVARRFTIGEAPRDELAAAWDAARAAAWDAAGAAAWDAARAAAWDAAGAAARAAAWDAAGAAARAAARAAAWAAARVAAWAAAWAAAGDAERVWQTERILYYLNGESA
jgi:hypothetical protein